MDDEYFPPTRAVRRAREVQQPVKAFGATAPALGSSNWHGQSWLDPIERVFGHMTGTLWNRGLTRLAGRITALEKAIAGLFAVVEPSVDARIQTGVAPLAQRVDAIERRLEAVMLVQKETNEHLQATASTFADAVKGAVGRIEALRTEMRAEIARLDATIAALPDQWRGELQETLDALRERPEAANALLHGVETFSASIARTIEEVQP